MKYQADYTKLHHEGLFQGNTVMRYKKDLKELFSEHDVKTALDYGCGKASAHNTYHLDSDLGVVFDLYDPGVSLYNTLPQKQYDAVICVDVLEHVPEDEVVNTLHEILSRATKCVFLTFCSRPAKKLLPISKVNAHVTQKDRAWWVNQIDTVQTNLKTNITYILLETK